MALKEGAFLGMGCETGLDEAKQSVLPEILLSERSISTGKKHLGKD